MKSDPSLVSPHQLSEESIEKIFTLSLKEPMDSPPAL